MLEAIRIQDASQLVCSTALLGEMADVLSRPALTKRLATIGETASEVLSDYIEAIELVEPVLVPRASRNASMLASALRETLDNIARGQARYTPEHFSAARETAT